MYLKSLFSLAIYIDSFCMPSGVTILNEDCLPLFVAKFVIVCVMFLPDVKFP